MITYKSMNRFIIFRFFKIFFGHFINVSLCLHNLLLSDSDYYRSLGLESVIYLFVCFLIIDTSSNKTI